MPVIAPDGAFGEGGILFIGCILSRGDAKESTPGSVRAAIGVTQVGRPGPWDSTAGHTAL